ncbi:hypothetical protein PAHAL_4G179600 [Panicum hallii]|uniref:Uncharacterized protein n=1 Tax=Panicum hallii TaxID=206008 RepID=A0A2T8JD87_9POAL|nr:hypothetical protein PAHAL_4G179600 [Panicum hallii]
MSLFHYRTVINHSVLMWIPRGCSEETVNEEEGRERTCEHTSQKPDSPAPVQVLRSLAPVQRHRSPSIRCTADEGTAGLKAAAQRKRERVKCESPVTSPYTGRLPYIEGGQLPLRFDLPKS